MGPSFPGCSTPQAQQVRPLFQFGVLSGLIYWLSIAQNLGCAHCRMIPATLSATELRPFQWNASHGTISLWLWASPSRSSRVSQVPFIASGECWCLLRSGRARHAPPCPRCIRAPWGGCNIEVPQRGWTAPDGAPPPPAAVRSGFSALRL